jgi:hypothetical protein
MLKLVFIYWAVKREKNPKTCLMSTKGAWLKTSGVIIHGWPRVSYLDIKYF